MMAQTPEGTHRVPAGGGRLIYQGDCGLRKVKSIKLTGSEGCVF